MVIVTMAAAKRGGATAPARPVVRRPTMPEIAHRTALGASPGIG